MGTENVLNEGRKATKPLNLFPRMLKAAVFPRRWNAQPIASFLPPGLSTWHPTAHHPTLPFPSASNTWPLQLHLPTNSHRSIWPGPWGVPRAWVHPHLLLHLSSANSYPGRPVCQAPLRSVPCGFPVIILFLGTLSVSLHPLVHREEGTPWCSYSEQSGCL